MNNFVKVNDRFFENELYKVAKTTYQDSCFGCDLIHLSVIRKDKQPIRSWKDMQEIKNKLAGSKNEGLELYPSEDRLIDNANRYHIWVASDENFRFDFGFKK
jgi:hypothetical protein